MQPKIHVSPEDVDAALAQLGLTSVPLLEAVQSGLLARNTCTGNDAPFFPGLMQWNKTLRALREALTPLTWRRSNKGNYCTAVEPGKRFQIAVAAGDALTGTEADGNPSTKRRRGPNTEKAVAVNTRQLSLFSQFVREQSVEENEIGEEEAEPTDTASTIVTWILLYYTEGDELRAELSLPDSFGEDGKIDGWKERIILGSMPLDEDVPQPKPDFGPDLVIDVPRRA
jgi:hypothetical protein